MTPSPLPTPSFAPTPVATPTASPTVVVTPTPEITPIPDLTLPPVPENAAPVNKGLIPGTKSGGGSVDWLLLLVLSSILLGRLDPLKP